MSADQRKEHRRHADRVAVRWLSIRSLSSFATPQTLPQRLGDRLPSLTDHARQEEMSLHDIFFGRRQRAERVMSRTTSGYAKYTGRLGVCLATSGRGAIHLLNGLYDAKMDGAPVLAITGQTYHDLIGTRYQQEVDLLSLFKDVAVYNQQVLAAGHVRALVDAGCRAALSLRAVAHITCPVDLQEHAVKDDEPSQRKVEGHTSDAWRPPIVARAREGETGASHG
jgi:pyruvate dehydrogenase (quinone)/pyruvate oxidase